MQIAGVSTYIGKLTCAIFLAMDTIEAVSTCSLVVRYLFTVSTRVKEDCST